jgi:ethanolamine ammonia-lyase small subunit
MAIDLAALTPARIGLRRTGNSLSTAELLRFQLDHARARDAVYESLDPASLGIPHMLVHSDAPDRATYLRRPDQGRRLQKGGQPDLSPFLQSGDYDTAIVIADGLSARAIHRHAAPLLREIQALLDPEGWRMAPVTVALQARVAIGDEIGELLGARQVVVFIGERPGLTSPDSLGIYLTYDPHPGRTDAQRNCISNVRPEGLPYALAARRLHFLMRETRARKLSGVDIRIDSNDPRLLP